jgi:hypothetical protein
MKKILCFIGTVAVCFAVLAATTFPINNGVLQTDLNANGHALNNVSTITFSGSSPFMGSTATVQASQMPALTGDVTNAAGSLATTIAPGAVTDAKVASANKDGLANVPSLRTIGTGSQQSCAGNDSRLSNSRTPTGPAVGAIAGSFPDGLTNGDATITMRMIQNVATGSIIGRATAGSGSPELLTTLPAAAFPALSGDITTPANSVVTTLKNTGTAGTYYKATFDAQGRETSGQTTLTEPDLSFSDVTTGNASTLKHGFVPKLTGSASDFYNGSGAFSPLPAGDVTKAGNNNLTGTNTFSGPTTFSNTVVVIGIGTNAAFITNGVILLTNTATGAFVRSDTNGNWTMSGAITTTGQTNTSLTVNSLKATDGNKKEISVPNGTGVLTNTGDGSPTAIRWVPISPGAGGGSSIPDDSYRISRFIATGNLVFSAGVGEALIAGGTICGSEAITSLPAWISGATSSTSNSTGGIYGNGVHTLDPAKSLYWAAHVTIPSTNSVRTKLGLTRVSISTEAGTAAAGNHSMAMFRADPNTVALGGSLDATWQLVWGVEAGTTTVLTNSTSVAIVPNHEYFFELTFSAGQVIASIDGTPVVTNTTCVPTNIMQTCIAHATLNTSIQTNFVHDVFARSIW